MTSISLPFPNIFKQRQTDDIIASVDRTLKSNRVPDKSVIRDLVRATYNSRSGEKAMECLEAVFHKDPLAVGKVVTKFLKKNGITEATPVKLPLLACNLPKELQLDGGMLLRMQEGSCASAPASFLAQVVEFGRSYANMAANFLVRQLFSPETRKDAAVALDGLLQKSVFKASVEVIPHRIFQGLKETVVRVNPRSGDSAEIYKRLVETVPFSVPDQVRKEIFPLDNDLDRDISAAPVVLALLIADSLPENMKVSESIEGLTKGDPQVNSIRKYLVSVKCIGDNRNQSGNDRSVVEKEKENTKLQDRNRTNTSPVDLGRQNNKLDQWYSGFVAELQEYAHDAMYSDNEQVKRQGAELFRLQLESLLALMSSSDWRNQYQAREALNILYDWNQNFMEKVMNEIEN